MEISILDYGMDFIYKAFDIYFDGFKSYLILFIIALVIMCIYAGKNVKQSFVYPVIALVFTIYNPIFMVYVIEKLSLSQRFYRFFWLLPIITVVAIMLLKLVEACEKKWMKAIVIVLIALCITQMSDSVLHNYVQADNIYKVDQEVLLLDDILVQNSVEGERVALYTEDNILALRQYDPSINSVLRRKEMLDWSIDVTDSKQVNDVLDSDNGRRILAMVIKYGMPIDPSVFEKYIEKYNVDYVIIKNGFELDDYMLDLGYENIGRTDIHTVYFTR